MALESLKIELGLDCPSFQLPDVGEKMVSLDGLKAHQVLVVGFTCNHCPYVQAYEDRFIQLVSDFKNKSVAFVCINSNDAKKYPEDSFDKMKERARTRGFNFYYLRDESQQIAKAFNAACTPEFYVYDQSRKLKYHGRLDNNINYKEPSDISETYLKDVVTDLLNNQKPRWQQTHALGCGIKWKES